MTTASASQARNSTVVQALGRAGMGCFGFVHIVVGYLALQIAFGGGGGEADQTGALAQLGSTAFGTVILWLLSIGLFAYGLWQILMAFVGYHWIDEQKKRTVKKIGSGIRGLIVIGLGISAIRLVTSGSSGGSGDSKQQGFTAKLLAAPAGKVLVVVVALIVLGVAVTSIVTGVRKTFLEDLDLSSLPRGTQQWTTRLGRAGYIAKGAIYVVIAGLIAFAAFTADASKAGGLDAALRTLAGQPFGVVALVLIALGFVAFGVYCAAAARAHRG